MGVQINGSEGNVIATKGTYSGNVTIGGTLTYEDVTNIDSVGLITARSGLEIGARPGVAASVSVDGNAIFSGIITARSNILVGSGITLSPGGDSFTTGVTTVGSLSVSTGFVKIPDSIIHVGDANTKIRFPAADTISMETAGSERLRILSSGGLTFNGDTATANALDDYEEGDWTPTYEAGSSSITVNAYSIQNGKYVKIGKMVYVEGGLRANVTNNSNGTYDIGGLPFTVKNTANSTGIIHGKEQSSWTVAPDHFSCVNNTTVARARGGLTVGDDAYTNANSSGFNSGSTTNNRVYFAGWYRVEG
jgi:hypothetical protein